MENVKPSLWANPTNRTAKLWNLTWDQVLALDGAIWKSGAGALATVILMTLFNYWEVRGLNVIVTIIGYLFIWWVGIKPTHLAYSGAAGGIFAALFDQDKTQGIGSGPGQLFKLVKDISYTYLLIGFSLITWDFSNNIVMFWVSALGIMILTQTGNFGGWRTRVITAYTLVCVIASLFMTFSGSWYGQAFDPNTGKALQMVDPVTGNIDSLDRSPTDCVTQKCYSAETGELLVAMSKEQALSRNVIAWPVQADKVAESSTGMQAWQIVVLLIAVIAIALIFAKVKGSAKVAVIAALLAGSAWGVYTYAPGFFSSNVSMIVQPKGTTFTLQPGSSIELGLSAIRDSREGQEYGVRVVRSTDNSLELLEADEAALFTLSEPEDTNSDRSVIRVNAESGLTKPIKLVAFSRHQQ